MNWARIQPGYGIIHRSVMKSKMSRGAKLVYSLLCAYANSETSEAFPSQETMAADLQCSEKPIREWLDELVAEGCIERRLEGMPAHNVYTVLYPQSGTTLPDKTGSTVPPKTGTTLPTKKNNEKENTPSAPLRGAAADQPAGSDPRASMTPEDYAAINSKLPWAKKEATA